jgi:tetrahydromethanopterin S-methyltransferase subunit H
VPFEANINKAHDRKHKKYLDLVSDIADNGFICDLTCFEVGSRGLITSKNAGHIDKILSSIGAKSKKTFVRELSKLALLSSYTIWNARHEPNWGSEDQPLVSL